MTSEEVNRIIERTKGTMRTRLAIEGLRRAIAELDRDLREFAEKHRLRSGRGLES